MESVNYQLSCAARVDEGRYDSVRDCEHGIIAGAASAALLLSIVIAFLWWKWR